MGIDNQWDEKYFNKRLKKYFNGVARRENPLIFAPALRETQRRGRGGAGRKKD